MAIFFIDLNKLKEYNENILQIEEHGGTWRSDKEQYVAERSKDDYIS